MDCLRNYIAKVEKERGIVHAGQRTANEESVDGIDFEVDEEAAQTLLEGSYDDCLEGDESGSHPDIEPEE